MRGAARTALGLYLEIRVIPVLLWSVTAVTLGTALAWSQGAPRSVSGYLGALLIGILLQGIVAHTVNDIADWRSGTDRDPAPRVISGGSKTLPARLVTERVLVVACAVAIVAAGGIGLALAAAHGWWLASFGAIGLAGAVLYTLPPVRLAYRPFAGEAVAFTCVWACGAGAFGLQAGNLTLDATLVAGMHAAACVAMLMLHHDLDSGPDSRARPPKVTSVVRLGTKARAYAAGWSMAAVALAAGSIAIDPAFALAAAFLALATVAHATVRPQDVGSVTRAELVVILAGLAAGLGTAALLEGRLVWTLLAAALLIPIELAIARRALAPLMAARHLRAEPPPLPG